jgi:hypothetical protein
MPHGVTAGLEWIDGKPVKKLDLFENLACGLPRLGQIKDMRSAPTLAYLALGFALLGCASEEDGEGTDEKPSVQETSKNDDAPGGTSDPKPSPEFEAKFDPSSDPKRDPTPPNGDQCIDNGDPGSAENVASALPDTDDCDNNDKTLSGIMKGAVDVDFYKLSATDKGISISHPTGCALDTNFESETAGTELCVFARCKTSTTNAVTGCAAGAETTSEIGMKGCCAAAPGKALPIWDCDGNFDDDSADFFLRVRQINGDKCLPYRVKYRF